MDTDITFKIFNKPQDYGRILDLQEKTRTEVIDKKHNGTIFFLEHKNVYTVGIRGKDNDFLNISDINSQKIPVFKIRRGGEVTWHGEGQLIVYPVINFRKAGFKSIKDFVNFFGKTIAEVLEKSCSIKNPVWSDDVPGIWVEDRKIAFVGLHFSKFVPIHGFSINLSPDINYFSTIVPCGIPDCKITSVKQESGKIFSVQEVSGRIIELLKQKIPSLVEIYMEEK